MTLNRRLFCLLIAAAAAAPLQADDFGVDVRGMHAAIQFRVKHLGYSWLYGRFNRFDGSFSYDPDNPAASSVNIEIDVTSLDSNHAERDKHLRSDDYLNTDKHPTATFQSTRVDLKDDGQATVVGNLTLHGVTREIAIDAQAIGGGDDPWGGYRQGFFGTVAIRPDDYGINMKQLGPASAVVELDLAIEGVRRK